MITNLESESWLQLLRLHRAIAVIRSYSLEISLAMARAVAAGGMRIIEITWNSSQPAIIIQQLRSELPHCTIGAGTILTQQQLKEAMAAGAEFIFSPHVNPALIDAALKANISIIPGALSPTEIVTAWQAGATCVKIFPVQALGGASYIKSLQSPLGEIPLIPTGGVTLENAREFIEVGAIAVGLSSELFPQPLVAERNWGAIAERAKTLCQLLQ
ncbi:MAG: bifunctional 4-hydroxy-2-oxoglutarate aldolase/2-dehydro-3-deoxy-phosphogluconate aldolase [Prochloron sp. SP5CPC1]|nr:bifunctional 4-hydroxy-2-oxoglutarate aldolase/2-dehydro-3-deoxy-phosphogluconate aldolase [Candidatus Paraprochloron terpiosi SP5CPC1]